MLVFHYLIQGRAGEVADISRMFEGRRISILVWDEDKDGCIFFPNSTWSEGRRRLIREVDFSVVDYICFVDADFKILRGSLDRFESKVSKFRPAIAVPVVDKNYRIYRLLWPFGVGLIYRSDE